MAQGADGSGADGPGVVRRHRGWAAAASAVVAALVLAVGVTAVAGSLLVGRGADLHISCLPCL